jgi:hypothetical protein
MQSWTEIKKIENPIESRAKLLEVERTAFGL